MTIYNWRTVCELLYWACISNLHDISEQQSPLMNQTRKTSFFLKFTRPELPVRQKQLLEKTDILPPLTPNHNSMLDILEVDDSCDLHVALSFWRMQVSFDLCCRGKRPDSQIQWKTFPPTVKHTRYHVLYVHMQSAPPPVACAACLEVCTTREMCAAREQSVISEWENTCLPGTPPA